MQRKRTKLISVGLLLACVFGLAVFIGASPAYAAGNVELKVLDPRGDLLTNPSVPINPRLKSLDGKKIGILKNTKPGADDFAPAMIQVLKEVYPTLEFKMWSVPYNDYPNKANDLKEIVAWSDAVVGMMGD